MSLLEGTPRVLEDYLQSAGVSANPRELRAWPVLGGAPLTWLCFVLPSKRCTWAQGWAWPGCGCTSVKPTAVPVQSAAWPGTRTAPGTVPPAPATGLAPASAGSAGRTSGTATPPCSAWAIARKVSEQACSPPLP